LRVRTAKLVRTLVRPRRVNTMMQVPWRLLHSGASSHSLTNSGEKLDGMAAQSCWSCDRVSEDRICSYSECGALQMPPLEEGKINYFHLLDLPVCFEVDASRASDAYKRLQKSLHPDKFSLKTQREQDHSGLWSSLVNRAYKVVSDPQLRARYLVWRVAKRSEVCVRSSEQ
jgi:hypothetical protein